MKGAEIMLDDVLREWGAEEVSAMEVYSDIFSLGEGLIQKSEDESRNGKALMDQITQTAEKLGTVVFSQPIRNSVAVRESQVMRSDLFTEAPKANATVMVCLSQQDSGLKWKT